MAANRVATDSTPVIDPQRNSVYVGTGNNYSVPSSVEQCFALNNNFPKCADPKDYFDSVVALDLDTGQVNWAARALKYDAWNVNCIETITPPSYKVSFVPGPNCPSPTGPDYDFGGAGPNLNSLNGRDILGIGEKSGIYWAINPNSGAAVWNTQVGPGSSLGGIEWGTATDGNRIYVPISNLSGVPYQLQPSGASVNSGSWAIRRTPIFYGRPQRPAPAPQQSRVLLRAAWRLDRQAFRVASYLLPRWTR
jgi:polyvinyl alcohol dehydrogenase (cytochrome)